MLRVLLRRGLAQAASEPLATRIAPMVSLADFLPGWRALLQPEPAGMAAASHARSFAACTSPLGAGARLAQPVEHACSPSGGSVCLTEAGCPWASPGCWRRLSSTPDASTPDADDSLAQRSGKLISLGLGGRDAAAASGYLSPLEDEDQPRHRMSVPLLHPKAVVTGEHHPCGAELLEFPFNAKAYYLGRDYQRLLEQLRARVEEHGLQTDASSGNLVVCVRAAEGPLDEREDFCGLPCETYIVPLDKMEAVVFFNGHGREAHLWGLLAGKELTDRYIEETRMSVIPQLERQLRLFPDRMVLQQADLKYLRTVAFVLGQTVALHYYEMQVDRMLQSFTAMNREMQRSGSFKQIAAKEALLRMVATNNLLFADIVSKLGILERFDVAWKHNDCNDVYEHLRADMEIENRNSNLQVKLHLVSENVKYLLELMQNQRSDFLEWIIIILIAAEIMVSLFDMFHKIG